MTKADDFDLASMNSQELSELHAVVLTAIRAAIRKQQEAKAAPPVKAPEKPIASLEQERDAWLARRKGR